MDGSGYLITILIAAGLAFIPASIASSKGRNFGTWYVYGFLLWIVAVIHAASLPYPQESPKEYLGNTSNQVNNFPNQSEKVSSNATVNGSHIDNVPKLSTIKETKITSFDINAPIDFVWYSIQKNELTDKLLLNIKLVNYFQSSIKAMKLKIQCFNIFDEPIGGNNIYEFLIQDINILPNTTKQLNPIDLSGFEETRSVQISIIQVLLDTGVWKNSNSRFELVSRLWEGQDLNNSKLLFGKQAIFLPEITEYGWNCFCGRPNSNDQATCIRCGTQRETALSRSSESMQIDVLNISTQGEKTQLGSEMNFINLYGLDYEQIFNEIELLKNAKDIYEYLVLYNEKCNDEKLEKFIEQFSETVQFERMCGNQKTDSLRRFREMMLWWK